VPLTEVFLLLLWTALGLLRSSDCYKKSAEAGFSLEEYPLSSPEEAWNTPH